jgi:hypothetical protein
VHQMIESKHQHGNAIGALMRVNRRGDALQYRLAISKNLRTEPGTSSYSNVASAQFVGDVQSAGG